MSVLAGDWLITVGPALAFIALMVAAVRWFGRERQ